MALRGFRWSQQTALSFAHISQSFLFVSNVLWLIVPPLPQCAILLMPNAWAPLIHYPLCVNNQARNGLERGVCSVVRSESPNSVFLEPKQMCRWRFSSREIISDFVACNTSYMAYNNVQAGIQERVIQVTKLKLHLASVLQLGCISLKYYVG